MAEQPFWLESGGGRCYACRHMPDGVASRGAIVLCQPFAEERKCVARVFVNLARQLMADGYYVLRFDYRGCGDSEGEFSEFKFSDWLNDLATAVELAKNESGFSKVSLVGIRLGASLALLATVERDDIASIVLWEPIVNGREYVRQTVTRTKLRHQLIKHEGGTMETASSARDVLSSDLVRDFDGYAVKKSMYDELSAIDLLSDDVVFEGPALVIQIAGRSALSNELEALAQKCPGHEIRCVREQPFWNRIGLVEANELIEETSAWLAGSKEEKRGPRKQFVSSKTNGAPSLVTFGPDGAALRGVFHEPFDCDNFRPAILLLHGWSGCRTGPHQIFVKLARQLCQAGFPVLRLDFRGRGESDGNIYDAVLQTMIEDAHAAIEWLCESTGRRNCVLVGICSGSEVAIGAAQHRAVAGVVLWSAPIFAGLAETGRTMRRHWHFLKNYLCKLIRPEIWRKFFAGRIQWRTIGRVLTIGADDPVGFNIVGDAVQVRESERVELRRILCGFKEGFCGPALMVYGTGDPDAKSAVHWYRAVLEQMGLEATVHLVVGANHSFYSCDWKDEVILATERWLGETFSDESAVC